MAEIKNLKKAANRILRAVVDKEKIILYGDADLDGVASVVILEEAIKELGGRIGAVYFPDRENEGYGINEHALRYLKHRAPALFIALDCGIANFEEIKTAKKMGFEILVIDHHKILEERLPGASIIVDPRQKSDKYPFKELATAGIVYKLAKLILSEAGKCTSANGIGGALELAALATIADMMVLENENEKLVRDGIFALNYTKRPGLLALMELINSFSEKIVPFLNFGGPKDHLNETYLLLTETDFKKAQGLAKILIKKNEKRKAEIKRIFSEAAERIQPTQELIIFEGDSSWPLVLLGPVASRLCQRYKKPVFLFKKGEKESPGAVRMPEGLDAVKAMEFCKKLLKTYGGHPPAAGFRLKNENLKKFRECLNKYFSRR